MVPFADAGGDGATVEPLHTSLARRLVEHFDLSSANMGLPMCHEPTTGKPTPQHHSFSTIAEWLKRHNQEPDLNLFLSDLFSDRGAFPIPEPLRLLADIGDFRLLVSTTFDPLLSWALDEELKQGQAGCRRLA